MWNSELNLLSLRLWGKGFEQIWDNVITGAQLRAGPGRGQMCWLCSVITTESKQGTRIWARIDHKLRAAGPVAGTFWCLIKHNFPIETKQYWWDYFSIFKSFVSNTAWPLHCQQILKTSWTTVDRRIELNRKSKKVYLEKQFVFITLFRVSKMFRLLGITICGKMRGKGWLVGPRRVKCR